MVLRYTELAYLLSPDEKRNRVPGRDGVGQQSTIELPDFKEHPRRAGVGLCGVRQVMLRQRRNILPCTHLGTFWRF